MDEGKYERFKQEQEERRQKTAALRKKVLLVLGILVLCIMGAFGYLYLSTKMEVDSLPPSGKITGTAAAPKGAKDTAAAPAPTGDIRQTPEPHDYSVLVKKGEFKLYLLDHGTPVAVWPVAVGKNGGQKEKTGDMKTPTGTFAVNEITNSSTWTRDFHDGKGIVKNAYGPWYIGLDTKALSQGKWDGIGIHGLHDPKLAGTKTSEGGVSMVNADLEKLKAVIKNGTKVTIEE